MARGIRVEDYDLIDYQAWAKEGIKGLEKSVSKKEFRFYKNGSKNLSALTKDITKVLNHKHFIYHQQRPKFSDLKKAFNKRAVCEVTLDARTLDNREGFSLHRLVILDINDCQITFHDPRKEPRPARKEKIKLFKKAWLQAVSEPELCVYNRQK